MVNYRHGEQKVKSQERRRQYEARIKDREDKLKEKREQRKQKALEAARKEIGNILDNLEAIEGQVYGEVFEDLSEATQGGLVRSPELRQFVAMQTCLRPQDVTRAIWRFTSGDGLSLDGFLRLLREDAMPDEDAISSFGEFSNGSDYLPKVAAKSSMYNILANRMSVNMTTERADFLLEQLLEGFDDVLDLEQWIGLSRRLVRAVGLLCHLGFDSDAPVSLSKLGFRLPKDGHAQDPKTSNSSVVKDGHDTIPSAKATKVCRSQRAAEAPALPKPTASNWGQDAWRVESVVDDLESHEIEVYGAAFASFLGPEQCPEVVPLDNVECRDFLVGQGLAAEELDTALLSCASLEGLALDDFLGLLRDHVLSEEDVIGYFVKVSRGVEDVPVQVARCAMRLFIYQTFPVDLGKERWDDLFHLVAQDADVTVVMEQWIAYSKKLARVVRLLHCLGIARALSAPAAPSDHYARGGSSWITGATSRCEDLKDASTGSSSKVCASDDIVGVGTSGSAVTAGGFLGGTADASPCGKCNVAGELSGVVSGIAGSVETRIGALGSGGTAGWPNVATGSYASGDGHGHGCEGRNGNCFAESGGHQLAAVFLNLEQHEQESYGEVFRSFRGGGPGGDGVVAVDDPALLSFVEKMSCLSEGEAQSAICRLGSTLEGISLDDFLHLLRQHATSEAAAIECFLSIGDADELPLLACKRGLQRFAQQNFSPALALNEWESLISAVVKGAGISVTLETWVGYCKRLARGLRLLRHLGVDPCSARTLPAACIEAPRDLATDPRCSISSQGIHIPSSAAVRASEKRGATGAQVAARGSRRTKRRARQELEDALACGDAARLEEAIVSAFEAGITEEELLLAFEALEEMQA